MFPTSTKHDVRRLDNRLGTWFAIIVARTGYTGSASTIGLAITGVSCTTVGGVFLADFPAWLAMLAGAMNAAICMGILLHFMRRRVNRFDKQLPISMDLMARAARAGEGFLDAWTAAGQSAEGPLRTEFLRCADEMRLGVSVATSVQALGERIGSADARLLAHAITMHQEAGGSLAKVLEKLARLSRERAEFAERMKSATAIARFAILAVTLLGLFVFLYMRVFEPVYLDKLTQSSLGKNLILYAIVSELVGLTWVALTLHTD